MSASAYKEENLPDLLPLYYNRLFPIEPFYQWLCYGEPKNFNKREISFTLHGDIYLRYQAFDTMIDFAKALHKNFPIKIDIGAVYKDKLESGYGSSRVPVAREIVFDIDMTDYDEVRTCCSGADVCSKCWKFMVIACKILDAGLQEDFGFENILWVFSGRRGIHCWVADKKARMLDDVCRSGIAEYFNVIRGGITTRKVKLPFEIHSSIQRSLKIIDEYFEKYIVEEQDILGNDERLNEFLNNIDENLRPLFKVQMEKFTSSTDRWKAFVQTFHKLFREQKIPNPMRHMVEEMKLYYTTPRLDMNVTKSLNHLLKAPFCVHPKTGKISVPFKAKFVDSFDPSQVPTISQIMDEVNAYDAKTKEQEKAICEKSPQVVNTQTIKIKDYKKTSLLKYVVVFNEFLRGLKNAAVKERNIQSGKVVEVSPNFSAYIYMVFKSKITYYLKNLNKKLF